MTGPTELWLVRHGESVANVAATHAESSGAERIDMPLRDADVPLSDTGVRQAKALGRFLLESESPPDAAFSSPYLRAEQTLLTALQGSGLQLPSSTDERLRDRELGILDLLTTHGVEVRHPEEAARKRWLGKFYYRPPGGESWADVALRIRSFLNDLVPAPAADRILITTHDAVVTLFVSVCLGMTERELLDFARANPVGNATVTRLTRATDGAWTLAVFADDEHLRHAGAPITTHQGDDDVHPH